MCCTLGRQREQRWPTLACGPHLNERIFPGLAAFPLRDPRRQSRRLAPNRPPPCKRLGLEHTVVVLQWHLCPGRPRDERPEHDRRFVLPVLQHEGDVGEPQIIARKPRLAHREGHLRGGNRLAGGVLRYDDERA